jgi:hypothetical protein
MDKNELIWVDSEFASRYKALEKEENKRELQVKALEEYMDGLSKETKADFSAQLSALEEEAAIYTGLMLKVKQTFSKAKDEALDASYTLWEQFDKERPSINQKISDIIDTLHPLKNELTSINNLLSKISLYNFEQLTKTIQEVASLDIKSQKIIEFVINSYPKEER